MNPAAKLHRSTWSRSLNEKVTARARELAEAGAKGRSLSPLEVKEVCEALRSQESKARTNFHSGVG